jgi:hypothetical protein
MPETTTVRQVLLGLDPYILIELTGTLDENELFDVSLSYGGGIEVANIRSVLEGVLDSLPAADGQVPA